MVTITNSINLNVTNVLNNEFNYFNIKKYTFTLDNSLSLQKEEISSTLLGRVVSGSG